MKDLVWELHPKSPSSCKHLTIYSRFFAFLPFFTIYLSQKKRKKQCILLWGIEQFWVRVSVPDWASVSRKKLSNKQMLHHPEYSNIPTPDFPLLFIKTFSWGNWGSFINSHYFYGNSLPHEQLFLSHATCHLLSLTSYCWDIARNCHWGLELETEVAKDYAKFHNHREGPYLGLLLVESAYYIHVIVKSLRTFI